MAHDGADNVPRALEDAGIPAPVITYVAQQKPVQDHKLWLTVLTIFLMISGPTFLFIIWNRLNVNQIKSIRFYSNSIGGILYSDANGGGMAMCIFGILVAAGAMTILTATLSTRAMASYFVISVSGTWAPAKWIARWQIQRLQAETNPALYVRKFVLGRLWIYATPAVLLLAIGITLSVHEANTYRIFTPTAYVTSSFLPWKTSTSREWASATYVETGCTHVSGRRGTSNNIRYRVTFADGTVVGMGGANPIGGSWLKAAEVIDRELRASGAQFFAWSWLDQDPYHPRCIAALRKRYSERDFERLKLLLRLPE